MPSTMTMSVAGIRAPAETEQDGECERAEGDAVRIPSRNLAQQIVAAAQRVGIRRADADNSRQLLDRDRQREAERECAEHRLRDELGHPAKARDAGEREEHARRSHERGGHGQLRAGDGAHRRGEHGGGR
jgi:hypothetical protein